MKKNTIKNLEQLKDEHYGKKGTPKRNNLEKEYETFKNRALIQDARIENSIVKLEKAEQSGFTTDSKDQILKQAKGTNKFVKK